MECVRQEYNRVKEEKIELDRINGIKPDKFVLDKMIYKGKTYTASRKCPVGQDMYWRNESGFNKKTKSVNFFSYCNITFLISLFTFGL